jgi:STE24 endopeptidase
MLFALNPPKQSSGGTAVQRSTCPKLRSRNAGGDSALLCRVSSCVSRPVRAYSTAEVARLLMFFPHREESILHDMKILTLVALIAVFLSAIESLSVHAQGNASSSASAGAQEPVKTSGRSADTGSQPQPSTASPAAPAATEKEITAYTLPPGLYAKARRFARARYQLYFVDAVWGLIVLLLVLRWKLAPKFRDWAERTSRGRFLQAAIYTPVLLLTLGVLGLPTAVYDHWLSRAYGISVQGWGSWAWDWTKGQLLSFVLGIILVWILYAVIRRSARRWWFYFWLCTIPILLFVFFISPWVIDPLFFKFEPLQPKQPELVATLENVVQRAGMNIPPDRMYWMKASEKLNALNAYVTGFGASKRVVVWDTTLEKETTPEVLAVFGHEMGHYVLGHIYKGVLFFAALLLVLLYLGYHGMGWAIARWGTAWGIRGVVDWASLPVLLLSFSVFNFLAAPVANAFSRYQEHQADLYGIEVTHGIIPDAGVVAAESFQIEGEIDLLDPDPPAFIKFWLFDHPSTPDRVQFVLTYDPWSKGEQPQFVK